MRWIVPFHPTPSVSDCNDDSISLERAHIHHAHAPTEDSPLIRSLNDEMNHYHAMNHAAHDCDRD